MSRSAKLLQNQGTLARKPQQQRAKDRVDQVLATAEGMLVESGFAGFSIPALAERLGYPRATVYKFFPTPYAVLNELAERQLAALEAHLGRYAESLIEAEDWRVMVTRMVNAASDFYISNPAAQAVLLAGPVSDTSFRALEYSIARLGRLTRDLFAQRGIVIPEGPPDVAALAVEFGTASFRMSYFFHGKITPEYTKASADVMLAFLSQRLGHELA
ncbi:TetR/AcrR family transcriptional regulator [Sinimarinibacterium sp. CAU 1509]|uniref:TetR/AcrR family transcriptional regulator n=1 Tax=Sinimarinibacterium sp. CAU 1509 TaxID=2562283 RepID=UPI0010ACADE3|nr:TetR/AcrR family transcriptional regulator [Sinimarinibacterium sp. CAU 1509]TJY59481.1 TetR/AcrR family transcriptional regulator [Sinimarinibacterium sp. CAU 1509]